VTPIDDSAAAITVAEMLGDHDTELESLLAWAQ
jgi:hypothetical protein